MDTNLAIEYVEDLEKERDRLKAENKKLAADASNAKVLLNSVERMMAWMASKSGCISFRSDPTVFRGNRLTVARVAALDKEGNIWNQEEITEYSGGMSPLDKPSVLAHIYLLWWKLKLSSEAGF